VTQTVLPHAAILAVNWAEVIAKTAAGVAGDAEALAALELPVLPFVGGVTEEAGLLLARHRGVLSLADCACLATARDRGVPALTADRVWATLGLPVEVRLIR
jgi:ribonuclease VapC